MSLLTAGTSIACSARPSIRWLSSTVVLRYNKQKQHARGRKRKPMYDRWPNSQPRIDAAGEYKTYVPHTAGIRHLRLPNHPHLGVVQAGDGQSKGALRGPVRDLTRYKHSKAGRNSSGRTTVNGRGGGHKQRHRLIDLRRAEPGEQEVVRIEYDPNRTAHIALLRHRASGSLSYILAPDGLRAGAVVQSWREGVARSAETPSGIPAPPAIAATESVLGRATAATPALSDLQLDLLRSATIKVGNCLQLRDIPVGTLISSIALHHDLEELERSEKQASLQPVIESPSISATNKGNTRRIGRIEIRRPTGGMLCRSAGSKALLQGFDEAKTYAHVKLPSGEIRRVDARCTAVIGTVSNATHQGMRLGKAGRARWRGKRPKVRGTAMTPTDHPHGGGKGKTFGVNMPVSRTGVPAKGGRTRRPGFYGNRNVIMPRPRGRGASRLQGQKTELRL